MSGLLLAVVFVEGEEPFRDVQVLPTVVVVNKRHDLYLIASLWVVATQVRASLTIFELSSVTSLVGTLA